MSSGLDWLEMSSDVKNFYASVAHGETLIFKIESPGNPYLDFNVTDVFLNDFTTEEFDWTLEDFTVI